MILKRTINAFLTPSESTSDCSDAEAGSVTELVYSGSVLYALTSEGVKVSLLLQGKRGKFFP